jgi:hypothetical protein
LKYVVRALTTEQATDRKIGVPAVLLGSVKDFAQIGLQALE